MSRILFTSIFTVLLFTTFAHAEYDKKAKRRGSQGGDIAYLLASPELKLSEKQRKTLESIKDNFEQERIRVRAKVKVKRREIEELFNSYDVDEEKVYQLAREMSELNGGLLLKANQLRVEARRLLTKEQFDTAKELIDTMRAK